MYLSLLCPHSGLLCNFQYYILMLFYDNWSHSVNGTCSLLSQACTSWEYYDIRHFIANINKYYQNYLHFKFSSYFGPADIITPQHIPSWKC